MKRKPVLPLLALLLLGAAGGYYFLNARPRALVLTGIVTTNDLIVSSQIAGQLGRLLVKEGDTVKKGQLLAEIAPAELRADSAYFAHAAEGATSAVEQNVAGVRYAQQQTDSQVRQAQATLAAAESARRAADSDLENARLTFERGQRLLKAGVLSAEQFDQSRTAYDGLKAHVASLASQVDSAKAAVALARTNAEQVAMRRGQLDASRHESAAAEAQREKADVRLTYTDIHAPIDGVVEVRAAREGEVVAVGQPIVTLVNPDDLWVRADLEETYIDGVTIGDHLTVRLPSGAELDGIVFFRAMDAGFATQRDVSRTKRDIKTVEVRLRVDNHDRRLVVGMTAYVLLPLTPPRGQAPPLR